MSGMMRAALLTGMRTFELREIERPHPQAGEALLKVKLCSICGSDIRTYNYGNERVRYPAVIGHEISGVIVKVGTGTHEFQIGDRICIGADVPSMQDYWSKNGMANLSDINYAVGYQFPGGYAEYCLLNELTLNFGPVAKIPNNLSFEEASLTEPLACCINGLERAFMEPGKSVLVIGAGPIGILLCRAALAFGAGLVVIVDNDPKRADQAKALGLSNAYSMVETNLPELTRQITDAQGFNIVLTACSSPDAQEQAVELVSKRGVVNFFGGLPRDSRLIHIASNTVHYREAYITGSHGSSPRHFKLALQLIASGKIQVRDLISHKFALKDIQQGFEIAECRQGLKVTIVPEL